MAPIPAELWKYGLLKRQGHLRERPEETIKIALLRKTRASVTAEGILFKRDYYTCDRAIREQWFDKARRDGIRWHITVAHDSRWMEQLYVRIENGGVEVLRPMDSSRKDMLYTYYGEEIDDIVQRDNVMESAHQSAADQIIAERDAKIQAKVNEARAMAPPAPRSQTVEPSRACLRAAEMNDGVATQRRLGASEILRLGLAGKVILFPNKGGAVTGGQAESLEDRVLKELLEMEEQTG